VIEEKQAEEKKEEKGERKKDSVDKEKKTNPEFYAWLKETKNNDDER
jgi:hypothetical protein|tara:strand:+ start:468 stop:608 length:141 start_codon:yes stop_codon:yes gene_type:complete